MIEIENGVEKKTKVKFVNINCASCYVPFMITKKHQDRLRKSGETFYCPSGHKNYYTKSCESELQQLKQSKDWLQQENKELMNDKRQLRRKLNIESGKNLKNYRGFKLKLSRSCESIRFDDGGLVRYESCYWQDFDEALWYVRRRIDRILKEREKVD